MGVAKLSVLFYCWGLECCPLYGVSGCPLLRGCFIIEVNGVTIGTSVSVRYIVGVRHSGVVVKRDSTVHNIEFYYLCLHDDNIWIAYISL